MKLLSVAGELSGDVHGAEVLRGLKRYRPTLQVLGIGGPGMLAEGLRPVASWEELQVHGLVEIVSHLPRLYRLLWRLEALLDTEKPDALLTIDYPGFNLKLGLAAHRRGIPVIHYSSPSIWAWRGGRIRTIARAVDLMILQFPFEAPYYKDSGVETAFLGHPLVGQKAAPNAVALLKARISGDPSLPVVALIPGSRRSELQFNLPTLLAAAKQIEAAGFRARWVIPVAPGLSPGEVEAMVGAAGVSVLALEDAFLPLLQVAHSALIASGTATLQAAMAGVPHLVVYRMSPLTYRLARSVSYVRHVSIVNIMAGREVVPELLQQDFTPQRVSREFMALVETPERMNAMKADLAKITEALGAPGAYGRVAEHIHHWLETRGV
ncbi:MAG: lipid-A-disaccharide synthase [Deltaproteobacteria bacterium]|nr:lipid-A-disaccharide synthase [Deltaproteobacteria bacterium]